MQACLFFWCILCAMSFFLKYALRCKDLDRHIKCSNHAMGWTVWDSDPSSGERFFSSPKCPDHSQALWAKRSSFTKNKAGVVSPPCTAKVNHLVLELNADCDMQHARIYMGLHNKCHDRLLAVPVVGILSITLCGGCT